jgi:hypothetical protein
MQYLNNIAVGYYSTVQVQVNIFLVTPMLNKTRLDSLTRLTHSTQENPNEALFFT